MLPLMFTDILFSKITYIINRLPNVIVMLQLRKLYLYFVIVTCFIKIKVPFYL